MEKLRILQGRVSLAIRSVPDRRDWLITLRELAWLLPALTLCALAGNFLHFQPSEDLRELVVFAAIALVAPALGEEILFRALIIPHPTETRRKTVPIALSIAAFVAWHPLQAWIFGPETVPVFLNAWFLVAVAALGLALARIYRATGSLWPCVIVHWLIVVGWKALLGGPPAPFA